jgi:amino acid transporter
MAQTQRQFVKVEDYVKGELSQDTNWWGAFVVGLAGTILVTGVTPAVLAPLGRPPSQLHLLDAHGWLLCLYLAELAAMLPGRTGGPSLRVLRVPGPATQGVPTHQRRNGLDVLARMDACHGREHDPDRRLPAVPAGLRGLRVVGNTVQLFDASLSVTYFTIVVGAVLSLALFVVAYLGIRFGTEAATVLGLLSMIPLTIIAVARSSPATSTATTCGRPTSPTARSSSARPPSTCSCSSRRSPRGTRSRWRRPRATSGNAATRRRTPRSL